MIWCPPDTCVRHITPPGGVASLSSDVLPCYARALGKVLPSGEFWVSQASNPATFGTTKHDLACVPHSSPSSNPVYSHAATSHESQEPRSSRRLDWGDGQTRDESASPPASQSSTSAELWEIQPAFNTNDHSVVVCGWSSATMESMAAIAEH